MMKEMKMAGKTFLYEKVKPEQFKHGACVFRVKDEDGDENWWVVLPKTLKAQVEGVTIDSPDDGHLTAFCMTERDALVLASSVCLAASMANISGTVKEVVDRKCSELAEGLGFDLEKLEAEVKKLKDEGKSAKEVAEILKPRMEEFKKKGGSSETKGGEW